MTPENYLKELGLIPKDHKKLIITLANGDDHDLCIILKDYSDLLLRNIRTAILGDDDTLSKFIVSKPEGHYLYKVHLTSPEISYPTLTANPHLLVFENLPKLLVFIEKIQQGEALHMDIEDLSNNKRLPLIEVYRDFHNGNIVQHLFAFPWR